MKKTAKKIISIISVMALMLAFACLLASAEVSHIEVNGERFSGTLAKAIELADDDAVIEIVGTIATEPVSVKSNITIQGKGEGAYLSLPTSYVPFFKDGLELLTVTGSNVAIKDITVDASYELDGAIGIEKSASDVTIENVRAYNGKYGAVNIYSAKNVTLNNVTAKNGGMCDFYITGTGDASALSFSDCFAMGSLTNCNVIISNAAGATANVNAAGIKCNAGTFGINDKKVDGARNAVSYAATPTDKNGDAIDSSWAVYYDIGAAAEHLRFGGHTHERGTAAYTMTTSRYGFSTKLYFDEKAEAEALCEGEEIEKIDEPDNGFIGWVKRIFAAIQRFFLALFW